jgi:quercetin dioxygenase-like cupin family protein
MMHRACRCVWALLLSVSGCKPGKSQGDTAALPQDTPASFGQPAVLGRREGEARVFQGRRPLWIKVDPQTLGSRSFTVGMEDLPPGDSIGVHKHLQEDEIVFIHRGTVEVTLGDSIRQAQAGGLVFIPRGTWIGFRVPGPDTATIVFMFNTPGFEKCLRFLSAPYGKVFVRPSAAAIATARENCHQVPRAHPPQ